MKIYTITLNPAYDVHADAEGFAPFHENLAHVTSREAGFKAKWILTHEGFQEVPLFS